VDALKKLKAFAEVTVDVNDGMLRLGRVPLRALKELGRALTRVALPAERE
jgi:hypothetical protein